MNSNSSPNQRPVPENLSSKEQANFAPVLHRIDVRRWAKQRTKVEMKSVLVFAALAGALMLGNAFAVAPSQGSAAAFFNHGKALVREGKPGPAILAYERAQQLAPRDPAIAVYLKAVRDTAGLAAPAPPWWQSVSYVMTMNEWAWSGSLALALICGATFLDRLLPTRLRRPLKALGAVGALAIFASITALLLRWPELSRAVVLNSHVTALIAPAKSAEPLFSLVEGEIVSAQKALHNFVFVHTADGRSGWVERTQIERIIPAPVPDRAG